MAPAISLRVRVHNGAVKTLQFNSDMSTYEACQLVHEKIDNTSTGKDHSLFFPDEDESRGRWLDPGRTLDFYDLKSGDLVEYKKKHRPLKVKLIDGSIKTIMIDDSHNVGQVISSCCDRMGIGNPEEFSFIVEGENNKQKDVGEDGKMTRSDKLMKKLRDKLHTDDEFKWLSHDESLREQGVGVNTMVVLRKKFFFSDVSVDPNDPVQLGLLYVQARSDIMSGAHPCSQSEACQQAALQQQIVAGDFNGEKKLELADLLPAEYVKMKALTSKIHVEHRKFVGMSELNAKYRYVQLCRSLGTYGVTFFLVKEKVPGKNKLVPRLLGIDRESIMRVDEKTKEVLKTWSLTVVRRWAAAPSTFTLDFGDYSESYYSVQTKEGDQISALISGYIDIIIKKQKGGEREYPDDEGEDVTLEENVAPQKATAFQFMPAAAGQAQNAHVALAYDAQKAPVRQSQLTPMQAALHQNIKNGFATVNAAKGDLDLAQPLPPLGNDVTSNKWKKQTMDTNLHILTSNAESHAAMASSLLSLTVDPSSIDYTKVGGNISTMSSNLTQMAQAVKKIAALMDDDVKSKNLLDAAKKLADSTSALLETFQPGYQGNRTETIQQVNAVGANINEMQNLVGEGRVSQKTQDEVVQLAKVVSSNAANCVGSAKTIAGSITNPQEQQAVIERAKMLALTSRQVLAITKALVPLMTSPVCRNEMLEAVNLVSSALGKLKDECLNASNDPQINEELVENCQVTAAAVDTLRTRIRGYRGDSSTASAESQYVEMIILACDSLMSASEAQDIVRYARDLANGSTSLVNKLKADADNEPDPDRQRRLKMAATALAMATQGMVQGAKAAARNPNDANARQSLKASVEDVRDAMKVAALEAYQRQLLKSLESKARTAASVSTQLIAAAKGSEVTNRNMASKSQLVHQCSTLAPFLADLVSAVREHHENPTDASKQLNLINASKTLIQPAARLIAASKAAVPTVGDTGAALQLTQFAKQTALAISDLKACVNEAADVCSSLEIDAAILTIRGLAKELAECQTAASSNQLLPLPGDTAEGSAMELGASAQTVASSIAQLLSAADQGNENYTGLAARDTANALKVITTACRAMASTSPDEKSFQAQVLTSGRKLMNESEGLVSQAKLAVINPDAPDKKDRLQQSADKVTMALSDILNCLPGQRDLNEAMIRVHKASENLSKPIPTNRGSDSFESLQAELLRAGGALNAVGALLVSCARQQPNQLPAVSAKYAKAFEDLVNAGTRLAAACDNQEVAKELIGNLGAVSSAAAKLLSSTKALQQDPSAPGVRQLVATSSKRHTDAINALLGMSASAVPGQRECDDAIRLIRDAGAYLDNSDVPVSQQSYFEALNDLYRNTKGITVSTKELAQAGKGGNGQNLGQAALAIGKSVEKMIKSAAQAGYLVGAGDPASIPGKAGIVDINGMVVHHQIIIKGCEALSSANKSQKNIVAAATDIAKHTSILVGICKSAPTKTENPVAKQQFNTMAKNIANGTSNLVKHIKTLAMSPSESNRTAVKANSDPLLKACADLISFASNPEFAAVPALIPPEARQQQKPILCAGSNLVEASCSVLETAKGIAANKDDMDSWQMFSNHHKSVSASINALINAVKASAPGQRDILAAIDLVSAGMSELDNASLEATMGALEPTPGEATDFQASALTLLEHLDGYGQEVSRFAKSDPEPLGSSAIRFAKEVLNLTKAGAAVASKLPSQEQQVNVIDQTKTVAEAALQILFSAKKAGGNVEAKDAHKEVDEAMSNLREAAKDLQMTVQSHAGKSGELNSVLQGVRNDVESMDNNVSPSGEDATEARNQLKKHLRVLVETTNQVVSGAASSSDAKFIEACRAYGRGFHMAVQTSQKVIAASADDEEATAKVRKTMQRLGGTIEEFIKSAANSHESPANANLKKVMAEKDRLIKEQIANFLKVMQKGSRGVAACDDLVRVINTLTSELETTVMFASMGQLDPITPGDKFDNYKETLKSEAAELVKTTKNLVMGAVKSQDELAAAADKAKITIVALIAACKDGAAALSSEDKGTQEMLLASGRNVAKTLADLATVTKAAVGRPTADPIFSKLKETAKRMVADIAALSKCVKSVEDVASRGIRSIEGAIDAIEQAKGDLASTDPPAGESTPEELLGRIKMVTAANQKISSAAMSGNQDDIIAASNATRRAVEDMCSAAKQAAFSVEPGSNREQCMEKVEKTATATQGLLTALLNHTENPDVGRDGILEASRGLAVSVGDSVKATKELKGSDWVDPNDPNVIAEQELKSAAASIEAAARKLADLKPRQNSNNVNEDLEFDQQILAASQGIAAATAAVVRAATQQQRELQAAGKLSSNNKGGDFLKDSKWRNGLVSAAKEVANSTGDLCLAAQSACEGNENSQDMLVAAARNVSACTIQLLVAATVKSGDTSSNSPAKRLQTAGAAVSKATSALVKAAESNDGLKEDPNASAMFQSSESAIAKRRKALEAQASMLKAERELEKRRAAVMALNKKDYEQSNYKS